mgnify:CR=1 FL=1
MVRLGRDFQQLQLDKGTQRREKVVALRGDGPGRRFGQGRILLERLVIGLHVPSFLIDSGDLIVGEVRIAGDQVQNTDTAISVCEDLLDQVQGKIDPLQINGHNGIRLDLQTIDAHITTLLLIFYTQGKLAVGLQRHDEIALQFMDDELHVIRRSEPDIIEYIAERNLVGNHLPQQLPVDFVFRHRRPTLRLAGFSVEITFGLGHQMIVHRQRHPIDVVQGRDEVDPLDGLTTGVVVMPTHALILIGVRLFLDAVVHNHDRIICLYLTHIRLDDFPQIRATSGGTCQKALNPVMTDRPIQQARQPGSSGQPERTDKIIAVNIEQFFIVHIRSLQHLDALCALTSVSKLPFDQ